MAWIEVHQSLVRHRKTLKLAAALGIPRMQAIGHLVAFWLWAVDNATQGRLDGLSDAVVAFGAEWDGEPGRFVEAMVASGFLDRTEDGLAIHDWDEYAGRLIERRRRDAERKRAERARPKDVLRTSDGHPADIAWTSAGGPVERPVPSPLSPLPPNLTGPNRTRDQNSPNGELSAEAADLSDARHDGLSESPPDVRGKSNGRPADVQRTPRGPTVEQVREVMSHFNRRFVPSVWAKPLALTKERADKIRARLQTYTVEQLCEAIDHLRESRWHCGDNDRGWRATPEYLFRNDTMVDRWLNEPAEAARRLPEEASDDPFIRGFIESERKRRGGA